MEEKQLDNEKFEKLSIKLYLQYLLLKNRMK